MDFSEKKNFIYSFSINGEDEFYSKRSENKSKTTLNGKLMISSLSDTIASVETIDLEMTVFDFINGDYKESFKNNIGNSSLSGMNEIGEFNSNNNDFSTDLYFPLSGKEAKVGDTYSRNIKAPIKINNQIVYSTGSLKITVSEIKDYGNGLCAKLIGDLNLSLKNIPENIKGKQEHNLTGKCEYLFNLEKGCFEEIKIPMMLTQITTQTIKLQNSTLEDESKIKMNSVINMKLLEIK